MANQDEAEEDLGGIFADEMIVNLLEIEELMKVDRIQELNEGHNIDIEDDVIIHKSIGVSGCLYLNQPLLNLKNNTGLDNLDIGLSYSYLNLGITTYTGLIRDVSNINKAYIFFDNAVGDPCEGAFDLTGISYSDVILGKLEITEPLGECSLEIGGTEYGDLMVGVSGRFVDHPLGLAHQVLTVDLKSPLGVTWTDADNNLKGGSGTYVKKIPDSLYNYTKVSSNITLIGKEKYTRLFRKKYGAKHYSVTNELENAPIGFFNVTKSNQNIKGHIVKLTGIGGLKSKWRKRVNIELGKCETDKDGDYIGLCNYDPDSAMPLNPDITKKVNLSGISYIEVNSALTGNFIYQVVNKINGPIGIFYLTKNIATNAAAFNRMSHSPSSDFNKLEIRWNASSGIELHKTKSTFDGEYELIPIQDQYLQEITTTLTGTNFSSDIYIEDYERITTLVSIENVVENGPSGIFAISKNHITNKAHTVTIVSNFGGGRLIPFNIKLELIWNEDNLLKIRKNMDIYDGKYKVKIFDFFPC